MVTLDLFAWWAVSISSGIVFLTIVSIYLYIGSRAERKESRRKTAKEHPNESIAYIALTAMSIVLASAQSLWWLLPGILFFLLSIFSAVEQQWGRAKGTRLKGVGSIVKNFIFVWVLLGLLVFYIVTIQLGSIVLFAVGNIIVEALLIVYLWKNSTKKTEQPEHLKS